jgi:uncharacterized protein
MSSIRWPKPMQAADFRPRGLLKNPHVQSVLASSGLRRLAMKERVALITERSEEHLLDIGPDMRLQGFHALPIGEPRGLVVLLHGWEGSVQSTYLQSLGARLLHAGYAVFRLNFRDHGDTHHLNEGIFHSCRIEEVATAVAVVAQKFPQRPMYIGGYSLGGNFALRVALRAAEYGIPLDYVFAVCPAIHPPHVLEAIETAPAFYHAYFMMKWRRSLLLKQQAFPARYNFDWARKGRMREVTQGLVERHTDFGTVENYLNGYSIAGDKLAAMPVPGVILAAADDPVCPVEDYRGLKLPGHVELQIAEFGGHCGFVSDSSLESFAEAFVLNRLAARL